MANLKNQIKKKKMAVQPSKTTTLYEGAITVDFYEGRHTYKVYPTEDADKVHVPLSVTKATGVKDKPALKFWAANLGRDFLLEKHQAGIAITPQLIMEAAKQHTVRSKEAKDSGTEAHEWIEQWILGTDPALPEKKDVMNAVLAFLKWADEHHFNPIATEKLVYSRQHDYVGLLDIAAFVDEKRKLIDIKTGKPKTVKVKVDGEEVEIVTAYEEHRYQTSAYQVADEEESGEKYDGRIIVYLGKDTAEFTVCELAANETELDYQAFLGLLACKKRDVEIEKLVKEHAKS